MIRRLTLKNWRSYKDFTLEFGPGATFIVATNGVGKSSLIEAARWALFGKVSKTSSIVRVGAASAVASVELVLPDLRVISIERALPRGTTKAVDANVWLDGRHISTQQLAQHLSDAYGTGQEFLAKLAMPAVEHGDDAPSHLGLEAHLGRYYGIDGLSAAIEQLRNRFSANEAAIRKIKSQNSAAARSIDQMWQNVNQAMSRVEEAETAHRTLQERLAHAREIDRRNAEFRQWKAKESASIEAAARLASRISEELQSNIPVDRLESAIYEALTDIDSRIEDVRVDAGISRSRQALLTDNDARLTDAHEDCPVCRRPLDESTVAAAHRLNSRDVAEIAARITELESIEKNLRDRQRRLRKVQEEFRQIPNPGLAPSYPASEGEALASDAADLDIQVKSAFNTLVDARTKYEQAVGSLEQAQRAAGEMATLEALFKRSAVLKAAIDATESTRTELLAETIRPLASEVGQRWQALFPARGRIETFPDGKIIRNIDGHELAFDAFSTGEGMAATILMRLLVTHFATSVDFCWFDEPLEHLDPDVRRQVGNALSRLPAGNGPLRQIVVTTYEERLARSLRDRDPDHVQLVDVRQAS